MNHSTLAPDALTMVAALSQSARSIAKNSSGLAVLTSKPTRANRS